ncbi:hypothetical protein AVEN_197177-1, partial [Araneus ventricosus]
STFTANLQWNRVSDLGLFDSKASAGTLSPSFRTTPPVGGRLAPWVGFSAQKAYIHGGSSAESGFELRTLRPRSRDLALVHRSLKGTEDRVLMTIIGFGPTTPAGGTSRHRSEG